MHNGQLHNIARANTSRQQVSRNLKQIVVQIHQRSHRFLYIADSERVLPCLTLFAVHIIIIINLPLFDCLAIDGVFL